MGEERDLHTRSHRTPLPPCQAKHVLDRRQHLQFAARSDVSPPWQQSGNGQNKTRPNQLDLRDHGSALLSENPDVTRRHRSVPPRCEEFAEQKAKLLG